MSGGTDSLPLYTISSRQIGGAEALRCYHESTQEVFATRPADRLPVRDFDFSMRTWHMGALLLCAIDSSAQLFERNKRMVATSGIDHILVQLYTQGGYSGVVDNANIHVRAGDICILDLSRTLDTRVASFRNITLVLPRPLVEAAIEDIDALHGMVLPGDTPLGAMLASHILMLEAQMPRLNRAEGETAARATVALITGIIANQERARAGRPQAIVSPFRMIVRYIDRNLHDPRLSPTQLAEAFALSRATLYRLFEPVGGVAEYIRMRRLTGAAMDLAAPAERGKRIADIASSWGFTSDTSFSRSFRTYFGIAPSDARDQAQRIWLPSRPGRRPLHGTEMALWLRTLRL